MRDLRIRICPECGDPVLDAGRPWHRRCFAAQDHLEFGEQDEPLDQD